MITRNKMMMYGLMVFLNGLPLCAQADGSHVGGGGLEGSYLVQQKKVSDFLEGKLKSLDAKWFSERLGIKNDPAVFVSNFKVVAKKLNNWTKFVKKNDLKELCENGESLACQLIIATSRTCLTDKVQFKTLCIEDSYNTALPAVQITLAAHEPLYAMNEENNDSESIDISTYPISSIIAKDILDAENAAIQKVEVVKLPPEKKYESNVINCTGKRMSLEITRRKATQYDNAREASWESTLYTYTIRDNQYYNPWDMSDNGVKIASSFADYQDQVLSLQDKYILVLIGSGGTFSNDYFTMDVVPSSRERYGACGSKFKAKIKRSGFEEALTPRQLKKYTESGHYPSIKVSEDIMECDYRCAKFYDYND